MVVFPDSENGVAKALGSEPGLISITMLPEGVLDEKMACEKQRPSPLSAGSSFATITSTNTESPPPSKEEKWWQTAMQVAVPFVIAGGGTIGAGLVLGRVQFWPVFEQVSQIFILVPALLGLKGNLDMCLASRLSTQANLGNMESGKTIWKMIYGNIALVQIQATVAAILVALFAVAVGAAVHGTFEFYVAMLLSASSVVTATTACFVLDFVMIVVIIGAHHFKVNPDNIATPLAASFGDVVSITVLSQIASLLYEMHAEYYWVLFAIVGGYLLLLPMWIWIVRNNEYTKEVLFSGWVPVLSALLISGLGGLVLDLVVGNFEGFVVFQPIVNGIGGNLVSVQASRISTMLHQSSLLGILPPHTKLCISPWAALFKGATHARTARILIAMAVPGHIVFALCADVIHAGYSTITWPFMTSYLFISVLQVMLLLFIAHVLIHFMWTFKVDPDNSAIPYLTALGDLLGSGLLALAFIFLQKIGYSYST